MYCGWPALLVADCESRCESCWATSYLVTRVTFYKMIIFCFSYIKMLVGQPGGAPVSLPPPFFPLGNKKLGHSHVAIIRAHHNKLLWKVYQAQIKMYFCSLFSTVSFLFQIDEWNQITFKWFMFRISVHIFLYLPERRYCCQFPLWMSPTLSSWTHTSFMEAARSALTNVRVCIHHLPNHCVTDENGRSCPGCFLMIGVSMRMDYRAQTGLSPLCSVGPSIYCTKTNGTKPLLMLWPLSAFLPGNNLIKSVRQFEL